jgi:hypothetical protein
VKKPSKGTILTLVVGDSASREIAGRAETAVPRLEEEIVQRMKENSALCLKMEEPIRDAAPTAEIVQDQMINADLEVDHNERTDWAIFHLCDMVRDLRGLYRDKPASEHDVAS